MAHLDIAYAYSRHVTRPLVSTFIEELCAAFDGPVKVDDVPDSVDPIVEENDCVTVESASPACEMETTGCVDTKLLLAKLEDIAKEAFDIPDDLKRQIAACLEPLGETLEGKFPRDMLEQYRTSEEDDDKAKMSQQVAEVLLGRLWTPDVDPRLRTAIVVEGAVTVRRLLDRLCEQSLIEERTTANS